MEGFLFQFCVHFINKAGLLVTLQCAWVTSILKCVFCYRWRFLRLDVFFWFFSSSLFDILITFEKFRYLICSYLIVICLHWRIFHLLGHESLHLVPFSLPLLGVSLEEFSFPRTWVLSSCAIFSCFVGCFVLLTISKFSSFKSKVNFFEKDFSVM